jgi:CBS domain containing-hemolysin-like protein
MNYLLLTLLFVFLQGFFALFEMASVSFNKVRLQYYVSRGNKRALWIHFLLKRPSRLFGTTLIGINAALQIGSECSRRFYESIHLDPDWAPLTQVIVVVILGELAPIFAARRHPEQIAMFCAPFMMALARLLTPIIWAFDALSRLIHGLMGKSKDAPLFLSREEVRMAFEEKEASEDEFNFIVGQIFQLKNRTALQFMTPLSHVQLVSTAATLAETRHVLSISFSPFVPIYHRTHRNIVAMAHLSDLLKAEEDKKILECARSPWFVAQTTSILEIIEQFRRNNQIVAVILDSSGQAAGLLTLDQILSQIFGEGAPLQTRAKLYVERTLSGEMFVEEFNVQFQAQLPFESGETLSDRITRELGAAPAKGEEVRIGAFIFTVLEPTLRGVKIISVHSLQE